MFEPLVMATGITIVVAVLMAYYRSGDPLSPLVVISPMLFYAYSYHPYVLSQSGELPRIFDRSSRLEFVQIVNLAGVISFCAGAQWHRLPRALCQGRQWPVLNRIAKQKILAVGMTLGIIGVLVIVSMLWTTGPSAFTDRKPYLRSPIRSGYYQELINLAFPAVLMVAVGWSGTRFTFKKVITLVVLMSPILYFAIFGGRRGPLFLSFAALGASVVIIRQRPPKAIVMMAGVGILGLLMLLLQMNRSNLFRSLGSEIHTEQLVNSLHGADITTGDEFVSGAATILASHDYERNYWGTRYVVMYLVRPIPQQLWPTKYADCGMRWMQESPGSNGFSESEWLRCVKFVPSEGSSGGFVSDLFLEFQFGSILMAFLLGLTFNVLWWRSIAFGGLWNILYFEALMLSIYLPTQSVGAWLYRLMLIVVPTAFVWNKYIKHHLVTGRSIPASSIA